MTRSSTSRPRVLVALTVYNGRAVVPAALASVARLHRDVADIDVLVLDDCSPDPGWSEEVEGRCAALGLRYYRSPRNLGIPRNVNLGLLTAQHEGYDHVVIANSDVVFAADAISQLVRAATADPRIGSVTAWSTNVSIYSLPNAAPDRHLTDQTVTDDVGRALASTFADRTLDIPAGISFAMLVPVPVIGVVGLMDPVFGRGYCEETDWSLRSLAAGFRITLGLGAFVYHAGGGSNVEAGLLSAGHTTVPANERIVDMRHPRFRDQVGAFLGRRDLVELQAAAVAAIVDAGIAEHGYTAHVGLAPEPDEAGPALPRVGLQQTAEAWVATATVAGFCSELRAPSSSALAAAVRARFGAPRSVDVFDLGAEVQQLAHDLAGEAPVHRRRNYPSRV